MSRSVYLPADVALAERLRSGDAAGPWTGYTASPGLLAWLRESDTDPESDPDVAEYAAMSMAGVAHLVDSRGAGSRVVLAADVADSELSDLDAVGPGSVTVSGLEWRAVSALFADDTADDEAAGAVAAARSAVADRTVVDALVTSEVSVLLERHDLLWFAPEELDALR